jgi:hypothetical protein
MAGRWFKANLHAHSTISDGLVAPAERVAQYQARGYAVLALTDHRKTQDVTGLSTRRCLVVSGIEVHPECAAPKGWWHFVGIGVPREMTFVEPLDPNRCAAAMRVAGAAVILAHPAWCGQSFPNFAHIRGLDAIEVWNATCDTAGRPASENEWAEALDAGWHLPAVASDDCHHADTDDVGEAWTWLKMKSATVEEVVRALRTGACYASTGPKIHDFRIVGGRLTLRSSSAAKIQFVAQPGVGVRRRAEAGRHISSFTVETAKLGGWPWPYVRAVVTDERGYKAWANPLYPREG